MSEHTIEMYDNKVWGYEVSEYGLEHGRLGYRTLARMLEDCIHICTRCEKGGKDSECSC